MQITIHHTHEHGPSMRLLLDIRRELTMISTQVQAVLDRAKQNSSLVQSIDLGMQALTKQVSDLKAQIAALPTGTALSDEDKAALTEAAGDLDTSIATLQSDIPANTNVGATVAGSDAGNASASSAAPGDDPNATAPGSDSSHQSDADAAKQATPLAGTGAPATPPAGSQS